MSKEDDEIVILSKPIITPWSPQKQSKDNLFYPWEYPDVKPPPLPPHYANWKPISPRSSRKLAGLASATPVTDPKPVHFNRPSGSPVIRRRNLFHPLRRTQSEDRNKSAQNKSLRKILSLPQKEINQPDAKTQMKQPLECEKRISIDTRHSANSDSDSILCVKLNENNNRFKKLSKKSEEIKKEETKSKLFSLCDQKNSEQTVKKGNDTSSQPPWRRAGTTSSKEPNVMNLTQTDQLCINDSTILSSVNSEAKVVSSVKMVSSQSQGVQTSGQQQQLPQQPPQVPQQPPQVPQQSPQVPQQAKQKPEIQKQPSAEEAPWRSPRTSRKEVGKPSPQKSSEQVGWRQPKKRQTLTESPATTIPSAAEISGKTSSCPISTVATTISIPIETATAIPSVSTPVSYVATSAVITKSKISSVSSMSESVVVSASMSSEKVKESQISESTSSLSETSVSSKEKSSDINMKMDSKSIESTSTSVAKPPAPDTPASEPVTVTSKAIVLELPRNVITQSLPAIVSAKNESSKAESNITNQKQEKTIEQQVKGQKEAVLAAIINQNLSQQIKEGEKLQSLQKQSDAGEIVGKEAPVELNIKTTIDKDSKSTEQLDVSQPPPPPPLPSQHASKDIPQQVSVVPEPDIDQQHPQPLLEETLVPISALPGTVPNEPSEEFSAEPIKGRIEKFEKGTVQEQEKIVKDKSVAPPPKPVGPWVKKTSAGVVQPHDWKGSNEYLPYVTPERQMIGDPAVSTVNMMLSQTSKAQPEQGNTEQILEPQRLRQTSQQQMKLPLERTTTTQIHQPYYQEDKRTMPETAPLPSPATAEPPTKEAGPLFDPWCDPQNPRMIQFQDVSAAAFKIKSGILNTPCTRSTMSELVDCDLFFKKEFNQYTGSFKERGARYALLCLSEQQKKIGVIVASAGNHGLAVAYHGQSLGIGTTVVMPINAPIMKVQACRKYGANVIVYGRDLLECREKALVMAKEKNLLYINGYDHPHILAGQGTIGLEIVEQVNNIDAVVIPVGGGGLIAGISLAVKSLYPHIKVIGVEAENMPSFSHALEVGSPVYTKGESSLADGLSVPTVGVNAFATAKNLIDKVVSVREDWIAIAILRLVEMEKAVVEGAGATALAALLSGKLPELKGKRVVIPLCGGNIDTTVLGRCLERGLAADGRLVKFTVTVSDRPGGIADLTKLLASLGVSIKDMMHERAWIRSDIFSVEVKVVCETRDYDHVQELKVALENRYKEVRFPLHEKVT